MAVSTINKQKHKELFYINIIKTLEYSQAI